MFAPLSSNVTGERYKQARVHDEDYSKKPELVKMSLPAVKTSTCLKRGKNHVGETGFADWSDASDYGWLPAWRSKITDTFTNWIRKYFTLINFKITVQTNRRFVRLFYKQDLYMFVTCTLVHVHHFDKVLKVD